MLVEVVEDDLGLFTALQVKNDAHAVAVALVTNVGDAFDLLIVDEVGGVLDEARLVDLIRDLGDDDGLAVFDGVLELRAGADRHVATARVVGSEDTFVTADEAAGREVGALNDLREVFECRRRLLDQVDGGVDQLSQIVRRDVGRHADRDAVGSVDQQIRSARRQAFRFIRRVIVVRAEAHRVLVELVEQFFREGGETRLGVAHGRRRVVVDRSEIALSVHQRIAHRERLRHADERVVDRGVAMRVVVAHHFADDLGRLAVAAIRAQPGLEHAVQDAPLNGLQTVSHVGQRASDNHAHRVVEIRLLHLDFDVDGNQVSWRAAAAQR